MVKKDCYEPEIGDEESLYSLQISVNLQSLVMLLDSIKLTHSMSARSFVLQETSTRKGSLHQTRGALQPFTDSWFLYPSQEK